MRLEHVLMNFLSNAVKFSEEGSEIRIKVGVVEHGKPSAYLGTSNRISHSWIPHSILSCHVISYYSHIIVISYRVIYHIISSRRHI